MTLNGPLPETYAGRRAKLLDRLSDAVLFIPPLPHAVYSNDVTYRYRTDTNIRYLSGFEEPAGLMLSRCGGDNDGFTLFVLPRDPQSETWTGRRAGIEGAVEAYGADHAHAQSEMIGVLRSQLAHARTLYYASSSDHTADRSVLDAVTSTNRDRPRTGGPSVSIVDAGELLGEMRLIKSSNEIDLLRRACGVSAVGHRRLMETLVPGRFEFQAEAILEYEFRSGGCTGPAYGTIVAGGESASVLHYTANDKILRDGELVLVDAGGEYGGYCADITRTFPVGPRYSTAQAEAYDIVLDAQTKAIDVVRPGSRYSDVHDAAVRALSEGLIALGVISGSADECIENEAYKPYFMHRTSHWLGMDVHDVGSYRDAAESRRLLPGIVLTVEPGLYFRADADVPSHLRGVGIRIEDDVAVTETGCDVLSSEVPKRRNEIEALRDRVSG